MIRTTIAGAITTAFLGLGLVFAPLAAAQSSGLHATDRAGDARGELLSSNQPHLDILAVDVRLDATTLTYTTRVATAPTAAQLAVATYQTGVQTNYIPFDGDGSGGFYGSYLRSDLVNGQATLFGGPEGGLTGTVSVNAATGEISASYSRAAIDADLTERYGDTLTPGEQSVLLESTTSGPYTQTNLLGTRSGTARDALPESTQGGL